MLNQSTTDKYVISDKLIQWFDGRKYGSANKITVVVYKFAALTNRTSRDSLIPYFIFSSTRNPNSVAQLEILSEKLPKKAHFATQDTDWTASLTADVVAAHPQVCSICISFFLSFFS